MPSASIKDWIGIKNQVEMRMREQGWFPSKSKKACWLSLLSEMMDVAHKVVGHLHFAALFSDVF